MKYVVVLGDGMSDLPIKTLGDKTPLMVARKPNIDKLAPFSELGLAKTVPEGMIPGSDTANLSILGYNPKTCYSGRSPLEALSMGITLMDSDIAVRCNLVTLSTEQINYEDKIMLDYSSDEIDTDTARQLIDYINKELGTAQISFHGGISYRHCMVMHDATIGTECTPPHDITNKNINANLPKGIYQNLFLDLQKRSYDLLINHPLNVKRIKDGKLPANSIWLWGEGTRPNLPNFKQKNGIDGAIISAVDLLKGIAIGAGMTVVNVEGATGNINTNYKAKAEAALKVLQGVDYVYIHIEAPDESGHQGNLNDKIKSIELIDKYVVGTVVNELEKLGQDFHLLICPDHPTPISTRTHSSDPVPYMIYRSENKIMNNKNNSYDENSAKDANNSEIEGHKLIDKLLSDETSKNTTNTDIDSEVVISADVTVEDNDIVDVNNNIIMAQENDLDVNSQSPTTPNNIDEVAVVNIKDTATNKNNDVKDSVEVINNNKTLKKEDKVKSKESKPTKVKTKKADTKDDNGKNDKENNKVDSKDDNGKNDKKDNKVDNGEKKPNKIFTFIKSHLLIVCLVIGAILISAGITIGYFVITKDMAFIKTNSDFISAISDSSVKTLVFKKNINFSGDITINKSYDWDMNGHTLNVDGDVTLTASKDLSIGTKKWNKYKNGGKIVCNEFNYNGIDKTFYLYANIIANDINIVTKTLYIKNNLGKTESVTSTFCNVIYITGNSLGTLSLNETNAYCEVYGSANKIVGGALVKVYKGTVNRIEDTDTVYVYPNSNVGSVAFVTNNYFVQELKKPAKVSILKENNEYYCIVSEVKDADGFIYSINGTDYGPIAMDVGGKTKFKLEGLIPGKQNIDVYAISQDNAFLDSPKTSAAFDFATQLDAPVISLIKGTGDQLTLNIKSVKYATKYEYSINGKKYIVEGNMDTNEIITDKIADGGVYVIEVTAKSSNEKYFTTSNVAMISYVNIQKLNAPIVTSSNVASQQAGMVTVTINWDAIENCNLYLVQFDDNKIYTTNTSEIITTNIGTTVSVSAVGQGYFSDSVKTDTIVD